MLIFKHIAELQHHLEGLSGSIGFVPTMGALHAGHLSLIQRSVRENDHTICSIFVNPLQFNNADDLEKYPRTLDSDIALLLPEHCDIVLAPNAAEFYPTEASRTYDFNPGTLDTLFEGPLRPGHFKGVATVVHRLFEITKPHRAYFGLKDYQQCMLISQLVKHDHLPVELHFAPTLREPDGLAMSSRNVRLSESARKVAPMIYEALCYAKDHYRIENITNLEGWCKSHLLGEPLYQIEYFNIVNAETLLPVKQSEEPVVALCAVWLDVVRLIDNMVLN